jgi:F-type H+-transporting ATPase subunit c
MKKVTKILSLAALMLMAMASVAFAAELEGSVKSVISVSGAIAISIAAFGGAMAQGRAVSSALEGIARNPNASGKITTPMIIGLALIESLVIYAFIIAIMLVTKF